MQETPFVDVLMSTFNGASWLDTQLATIFAQDYQNWRLLIRDDGSSDQTRDIIKIWRDRYPEKITFVDESTSKNLGLGNSFSILMSASTAKYIVVADQDDVWYGNKISRSVAAIQLLAEREGMDKPLLIHTDVRVVDQNLRELCRSGMQYRGMCPIHKRTLASFCLENSAHGCTLILNRKLAEMCNPFPSKKIHVDWWIALVAEAFGKIEYRPEINMDWRRHKVNMSQASSLKANFLSMRHPLAHRKAFYEKLQENYVIIEEFLARFDSILPQRRKDALQFFLDLESYDFLRKRYLMLHYRLFFSSWMRALGFFVLM